MKMKRRGRITGIVAVSGFCALSWIAFPAEAQMAPATLGAALSALQPTDLPQGQVMLTVQPDAVRPAVDIPGPQDDGLPVPNPGTLAGVAQYFGQIEQSFGPVTALAPRTMTLLAAHPAPLDAASGGLPLSERLKLFLGSLTVDQLQELGTRGLSSDDLSGDQRSLLLAALGQPLAVVPAGLRAPQFDPKTMDQGTYAAAMQQYKEQVKVIPPDVLAGSRLHANLMPQYIFPVPGGDARVFAYRADSRVPEAFQYDMSAVPVQDDRPGPKWVQVAPNAPKPGDLALDGDSLAKPVSLAGLNTAGDLVKKIGEVTGLELYCDPHYALQALVVKGDVQQSYPAGDLLQALGLCLCATWRKVGPAYVLTDDVEGVAARRHRIRDVVQAWNSSLDTASANTGRHLADVRWYDALPFAPDDPGALPRDAVDTLVGDPKTGYWGSEAAFSALPQMVQDDLRVRLQTEAQQNPDGQVIYADAQHNSHVITKAEEFQRIGGALGDDYKVTVDLECRFFVETPDGGTVALDTGKNVFFVPFGTASGDTAPAKTAAPVTLHQTHRGVMANIGSADDARVAVDTVAGLGFNALYVPAFSHGQTFFDNTAIPPAGADSGGALKAAIDEGAKRGVGIYAVVDALRWGDPSPGNAALPLEAEQDAAITGETAQRASSRVPVKEIGESERQRLAGAWVSPADPLAEKTLKALLQQLAQVQGLAGIAVDETVPPGYGEGALPGKSPVSLGYNPDMRLAFLRSGHADPLDFEAGSGKPVALRSSPGTAVGGKTVDLSLPEFDRNEGADAALDSAWTAFRAAKAAAFTASLAQAAPQNVALLLRPEAKPGDPWKKLAQPLQKASQTASGYSEDPAGAWDVLVYDPEHPDALSAALGKANAPGVVIDMTAPGVDLKRDLTAVVKGQ